MIKVGVKLTSVPVVANARKGASQTPAVWILTDGTWDDAGVWKNLELWKDV